MKFRHARHTSDLQKIEKFYTTIAGLEKLGGFKDHDNYNGIFLGHKSLSWHLEFTASDEKPTSRFDEDDILVFYLDSTIELFEVRKIIERNHLQPETPKNPYWAKNGIMLSDPDGYKIVFASQTRELNSPDELSELVREKSIRNWSELLDYIRKLPYGRNQNRADLSLVLKEGKGTCSSKHAFLKKIADLNGIEQVKLILGVYKMNHINSPKIKTTILDSGLEYIPEAHCYLKLNNRRFDLMSPESGFEKFADDVLEEIEIEPEQVDTFKVELHRNFLKKWITESAIDMNFERVWEVREKCIQKLGE